MLNLILTASVDTWFKFLRSIVVTTVIDGNEKTNVSPSKLRLHWAAHGFFCKLIQASPQSTAGNFLLVKL